jgi:glycosyltransferase involved in cell wall biosynthesis
MSFPKSTTSVIVTVYNEEKPIGGLLDSLIGQTVHPDEAVFVDAGSRDRTVAILESYASQSPFPIRVFVEKGANISAGRNVAIRHAEGDVIAVTDAGVRIDPHWFERITAPFKDEGVHAVAGFFVPDMETVFETAMGATVLPRLEEIDPDKFLPSSRSVAFRKSAWETVGGYPEDLAFCEDIIFDSAIKERFGFTFAGDAIVAFRPRGSLKAFWRQYSNYAYGDGQAFPLFIKRHVIRYGAYLVALPAILLLAALDSPWWSLMLLFSIPAMFAIGWRRLFKMWHDLSAGEKLQAFLWSPVIRIVGDLAKMVGYPRGLLWRLRHRNGHALSLESGLARAASKASSGVSRLIF